MTAWIFKSEPEDYAFEELVESGCVRWDGIRNYGARNNVRECAVDDVVLFYHSRRGPSIVGVARVATEPYPDPTQFDPESDYFDPKSNEDDPRWWSVDIVPERRLPQSVTLASIKSDARFSEMVLVRRQRLSVSPVSDDELAAILELAAEDA